MQGDILRMSVSTEQQHWFDTVKIEYVKIIECVSTPLPRKRNHMTNG
jgi:hypothetical protein